MTISSEQIQIALNEHSEAIARHENRLVVHESAMAHQDALSIEIRQNLAQASQILDQVAIGQAENQRQIARNQEQITLTQEQSARTQEQSTRTQEQSARTQEQINVNQEQIAILMASIIELRNTVSDMVRNEGGTPSS
jgi:chromosome segregation ATPase